MASLPLPVSPNTLRNGNGSAAPICHTSAQLIIWRPKNHILLLALLLPAKALLPLARA
jgi:hypothetical protein